MIAGLSREDLLHELFTCPRRAIVTLPDSQIIERPGFWQIITPSLKKGGLNEVICESLPEGREDEIIDEAISPYRTQGLRFRWTLRPNVSPPDLGERLAKRGLLRSEADAVARATTPVLDELPEGITVDKVTQESVDDFTRVMAEGWQVDPEPVRAMNRRIQSDPSGRHHLFLARCEGAPAATASYTALDRSAYLIGAVVLPAYRGRGLYRALVDARIRHAKALGIGVATSLAMAGTSAPILARMGFVTVCPAPAYVSS